VQMLRHASATCHQPAVASTEKLILDTRHTAISEEHV
jgi:hypothetical protein